MSCFIVSFVEKRCGFGSVRGFSFVANSQTGLSIGTILYSAMEKVCNSKKDVKTDKIVVQKDTENALDFLLAKADRELFGKHAGIIRGFKITTLQYCSFLQAVDYFTMDSVSKDDKNFVVFNFLGSNPECVAVYEELLYFKKNLESLQKEIVVQSGNRQILCLLEWLTERLHLADYQDPNTIYFVSSAELYKRKAICNDFTLIRALCDYATLAGIQRLQALGFMDSENLGMTHNFSSGESVCYLNVFEAAVGNYQLYALNENYFLVPLIQKRNSGKIVPSSEDKRAKIKNKLKNFSLMDDEFMTVVFASDKKLTEKLLRIILENNELIVETVRTQVELKNLKGRSVRLDIDASDLDGKEYDIEIQRASKGAVAERARYNSAMLDANTLLPADEFDALPETYVIFITEEDIYGKGLPVYHIDRQIAELKTSFNDRAHIVYVNSEYRGDSPLGQLMEDFHNKDTKGFHNKDLEEQVKYFKSEGKGGNTMSALMEELIAEVRAETAKALLSDGIYSYERIAEITKLSLEEVESLANALLVN